MPTTRIAYLELPSNDVAASKQFYGSLFGWSFEDWGEDYASFTGAGLDGGFNGEPESRSKAPLVVLQIDGLQTDGLEAMVEKVVAAGGAITAPIFAFPGGRRFHFTDLSGQELAVMQPD